MPYFSLFSSCHRKEMSFICTYATKTLFSPHDMVCIHIPKLHGENHDQGIIIFIRKLLKYLPPSHNFIPTLLIFTGYNDIVDFHWVHIRSLNLWSTVNQCCEGYWNQSSTFFCSRRTVFSAFTPELLFDEMDLLL